MVAGAMPSKERVVLASFEMTELFASLNKLKAGLGTGARVILVDGRRSALLGGLESQRGKALEIEPVTRALKGESASARTADEEDKVIVSTFRPIAEAGMAIAVTRREDDIEDTGASFPWGGLFGSFIVGFIGAIIIFVFVRKALDPIGLLHQAASRVAQGDLSERVPILTDDEIGDISKIWNDVVARLQKAEGNNSGGHGR